MLNKETELMIDKFIDKFKEISPAISSESCRWIAEGIIFNAGGNKHLVVRSLNHELVKLKRQQHIPMEASKVNIRPSIDEFIAKNIKLEILSKIRSAFKGEN